jgi:leucyl-tRNA synthetase
MATSNAEWLRSQPGALEQAEIEMMIQVNGGSCGSITVAKDAQHRLKAMALACESVKYNVSNAEKSSSCLKVDQHRRLTGCKK